MFTKQFCLTILFFSFSFLLSISTTAQCDTSGTFVKTFGGSGNEKGHSIVSTNDGGFIIVGETTSFGAGAKDILVIKLNSNNSIQWSKTYGGSGDDYGLSLKVIQTNDLGYVIGGFSKSFGGTGTALLFKIDSNGNLIWQKKNGTISNDMIRGLFELDNGDILLTGSYDNSAGRLQDILAIKIDSNGNIIWKNRFGNSTSDHGMYIQEFNKKIYIAGLSYVSGNGVGILMCLDTLGNKIWEKYYNVGGFNGFMNGLITHDSTFVGIGVTTYATGIYDILLVKIDLSGNLIWSKSYGGSSVDVAAGITLDNNNELIIEGHTSSFGNGNNDLLIFKIDIDGNLIWSKTYGGVNDDKTDIWASSIAYFNDNIFITGGTQNNINEDVIFAKITNCGNIPCNSTVPNLIVSNVPLNSNTWSSTSILPPAFTNIVLSTSNVTSNIIETTICSIPTDTLCSIEVNFAISDSSICKNDTLYFTNLSTDATSFQWFINDVKFSTNENPSFYLDTIGIFEVKLIASNSSCSDTFDLNVQNVAVDNWEHPNYLVCSNDSLFEPYSLLFYSIYNYYTISDSLVFPFPYFANTNQSIIYFKVENKNALSECYTSDTFHIQIKPTPSIKLDFFNDKYNNYNFTGCCGISYIWSEGSLFNDSTLQNPTAELYNSEWIYLEVTDSNSCVTHDSIWIEVNQHVPNIITPNMDGINDYFAIKGLKIDYIQIYNRWGRIVFETENYQNNWNGENVPDGLYYYHIQSNNQNYKGWLQIIR